MTTTPSDNYTAMKAFLHYFAVRYLDQRITTAADRPMAVLARCEAESPARAASGLRMAVNNCLEISAPWPLSQIMALDAELHAKGLLSVSSVRSQVWGRYAAMLKRGQVRNGAEWAVAQAVLADRSLAQTLPEAERHSLQGMVTAYDDRARPRT